MHQNLGVKDVYITTGVTISQNQQFEQANSCYLMAQQNLYKVSEDVDGFEDYQSSGSEYSKSSDED